jgi:uncharacterized oligopeptide transporter (OPT) family protein
MACTYFNVAWWVGLATIPMAFLAAVIGAQSTALTSFTPTGTLAKLTQATFGVLRPGNVTTNLAAAGMVGTAVSNCSSFLTELKPGYLLGASPRKQAVGHLLGILAGASASIALFYTVIVRDGLELLGTPDYPFPAAMMWKSLSELFTQGLSVVPNGAAYGALAGAIVAGVIEVANLGSQKRIPLSAVGIGLAFLLPFSDCLSIFVGAAFFWLAGRLSDRKVWSALTTALSFHREALCAGAIAGGAVAGMAAALLERWLPR